MLVGAPDPCPPPGTPSHDMGLPRAAPAGWPAQTFHRGSSRSAWGAGWGLREHLHPPVPPGPLAISRHLVCHRPRPYPGVPGPPPCAKIRLFLSSFSHREGGAAVVSICAPQTLRRCGSEGGSGRGATLAAAPHRAPPLVGWALGLGTGRVWTRARSWQGPVSGSGTNRGVAPGWLLPGNHPVIWGVGAQLPPAELDVVCVRGGAAACVLAAEDSEAGCWGRCRVRGSGLSVGDLGRGQWSCCLAPQLWTQPDPVRASLSWG